MVGRLPRDEDPEDGWDTEDTSPRSPVKPASRQVRRSTGSRRKTHGKHARRVGLGARGSSGGDGTEGSGAGAGCWRAWRLAVATLSGLLGVLQLLAVPLWHQQTPTSPYPFKAMLQPGPGSPVLPSAIALQPPVKQSVHTGVAPNSGAVPRASATEAAAVATAAAAKAAEAAAVAVAAIAQDERRTASAEQKRGEAANEPVPNARPEWPQEPSAARQHGVALGGEAANEPLPNTRPEWPQEPAVARQHGVALGSRKLLNDASREKDAVLGRGSLPGRPPPGDPRFFPLVQRLRVEGPCCASIDPEIRVLPGTGHGAKSPDSVLAHAASRAEKALRRLRAARSQERGAPESDERQLSISVIRYVVTATDETLDERADWSYRIVCDKECTIEAKGVYGAVTAMESTIVQLFAYGGEARFQKLWIDDWPTYKVRALMVDTGRRFVPKDVLLHQVIDGMALMKMNLLQLHLNDFCRFALALPSFPELANRSGVLAGQHTVDDIKEVVSYARARGIRVVPEVDLPGHALGLLPLRARGMTFCEPVPGKKTRPEQAAKVFDDPEGKTRAILRKLLAETAEAFGPQERWFHVGGDEASPTGMCTQQNINGLEAFVAGEVVHRSLGKTPVGWEELRLKEPEEEGVRAAGSTNDTVVIAWMKATARGVVRRGHPVLAANLHQHYLDYSYQASPIANFWYNISARRGADAPNCVNPTWEARPKHYLGGLSEKKAKPAPLELAKVRCIELGFRCAGVTCKRVDSGAPAAEMLCEPREGDPFMDPSKSEDSWAKVCSGDEPPELQQRLHDGLLGGLSAMWTDRYSYIYQCGAADASWGERSNTMPTASLMFLRDLDASFGRSLAGMIWPRGGVAAAALWRYSPEVSGAILEAHAAWSASLLRDVAGVASCPPGCQCDELNACGKPYPVLWSGKPLVNSEQSLGDCYSVGTTNQLGPEGVQGVGALSLRAAFRACFWLADKCSGVSCTDEAVARGLGLQGGDTCVLHRPGSSSPTESQEAYVKSAVSERCSPYLAWRSATLAPTPPPPPPQVPTLGPGSKCRWSRHEQKFLGGFAGDPKPGPFEIAKNKCIQVGSRCRGITCDDDPAKAATLYASRKQCASEAMNMGEVQSPEACAALVAMTPTCGRQFMFSPDYSSWGCRCCTPHGADGPAQGGELWNVYTATGVQAQCTIRQGQPFLADTPPGTVEMSFVLEGCGG